MPTALFVSPHLDDAAFSAGGLCARLADAGWRCVIGTVFTRSVDNPTGFALACQTDKGLAPEADYMAIRRAEDVAAVGVLGATALHGELPEAPHRGYGSAAALFGGDVAGDSILGSVCALVAGWMERDRPDLVLAPQGLGAHVDHRRVVEAMLVTVPAERRVWWRDTPYAIRMPGSLPIGGVIGRDIAVPVGETMQRKVAASAAYATQIGFQFGGADRVGSTLVAFAAEEGGAAGHPGVLAERFLSTASALDAHALR